MKESFKCVHFDRKTGGGLSDVKQFGVENAKKVNAFHKSFPEYSETPLRELKGLAAKLGVKGVYVKDESYRFGLNAFKVLGGSYAIAKYLCRRFNIPLGKDTFALMRSPEYSEQIKKIVFATATDGNHGRGVAWFSSLIGCDAHVFLPAGTAAERLENIKIHYLSQHHLSASKCIVLLCCFSLEITILQ